jgi:hypothetical protein
MLSDYLFQSCFLFRYNNNGISSNYDRFYYDNWYVIDKIMCSMCQAGTGFTKLECQSMNTDKLYMNINDGMIDEQVKKAPVS